MLEEVISENPISKNQELEELARHFDKYKFEVSGLILGDEESTAILYSREGAILGQHIKYMQGVYAFNGEKELEIVNPVDTRGNDESLDCVRFKRLRGGQYEAVLRHAKSGEEENFSIDFIKTSD